jgi:hypothetical protein
MFGDKTCGQRDTTAHFVNFVERTHKLCKVLKYGSYQHAGSCVASADNLIQVMKWNDCESKKNKKL